MIYWHPKLLRYLPSPDSRRGENKTIGRSRHICPLSVNNLTHNYSSRVKERQREKKNDAFLLHFKHSTRAHSCPNPSITWLTDWMLKYRNTLQNRTYFNYVWKANLPLSKCAVSMQWQEVNGLFSNLHSLFIISSQNFLTVMFLCSTDRKMKLHKDNESIIRSFAKLSTDYSIMPILRQKFTNQTTLFWLDNRKLEEKQYKKAHNLSHLILIQTVTAN